MAHVIMDHRVSWCFGTTVPPGKGHTGRLASGCCESQGTRVRHLLYSEGPNVPVARQRMPDKWYSNSNGQADHGLLQRFRLRCARHGS